MSWTTLKQWPRARRWRQRTVILLAAAVIALLAAGVALGQASTNFDLACRSHFTAAGGTTTTTNRVFGITGALGVPAAGTTLSGVLGVRSGFLPGYPVEQTLRAEGDLDQAAPAQDEQGPLRLHLPILRQFTRIVRGGC